MNDKITINGVALRGSGTEIIRAALEHFVTALAANSTNEDKELHDRYIKLTEMIVNLMNKG